MGGGSSYIFLLFFTEKFLKSKEWGVFYCIYYKRARFIREKCASGAFWRGAKIDKYVLGCDGILWGGVLIESLKRQKCEKRNMQLLFED